MVAVTTAGASAGFVVSGLPYSGIVVTSEPSNAYPFGVNLAAAPTEDVVVSVVVSSDQATVAPTQLVFNASNWDTEQTVVATSNGAGVAVADGDVDYSILLSPASADAAYAALPAQSVPCQDWEPPYNNAACGRPGAAGGVCMQHQQHCGVRADAVAVWSCKCIPPLSGEKVGGLATCVDAHGATVPDSSSSLKVDECLDMAVFSQCVWMGQYCVDPDHTTLRSWECRCYAPMWGVGKQRPALCMTPGITLAPDPTTSQASPLVTTEAGGSVTFTIALTNPPDSPVAVFLGVSDAAEGVLNATQVSFTRATWNVTQTVKVTGLNDSVADGAKAYTVQPTRVDSADRRYSDLPLTSVRVFLRNTEGPDAQAADTPAPPTAVPDTPAPAMDSALPRAWRGLVSLSPSTGLSTAEDGTTVQTLRLRLLAQPSSAVVVTLTVAPRAGNAGQPPLGKLNVTSLTFDAQTWAVPQGVALRGVDNEAAAGNERYDVRVSAASGDARFSVLDAFSLGVESVDDDVGGDGGPPKELYNYDVLTVGETGLSLRGDRSGQTLVVHGPSHFHVYSRRSGAQGGYDAEPQIPSLGSKAFELLAEQQPPAAAADEASDLVFVGSGGDVVVVPGVRRSPATPEVVAARGSMAGCKHSSGLKSGTRAAFFTEGGMVTVLTNEAAVRAQIPPTEPSPATGVEPCAPLLLSVGASHVVVGAAHVMVFERDDAAASWRSNALWAPVPMPAGDPVRCYEAFSESRAAALAGRLAVLYGHGAGVGVLVVRRDATLHAGLAGQKLVSNVTDVRALYVLGGTTLGVLGQRGGRAILALYELSADAAATGTGGVRATETRFFHVPASAAGSRGELTGLYMTHATAFVAAGSDVVMVNLTHPGKPPPVTPSPDTVAPTPTPALPTMAEGAREATKVVGTAVSGVVGVLSLVGGAGGSTAPGQELIIGGIECKQDDGEEDTLEIAVHPLQFSIKGVPQAGAVVGNVGLSALAVLTFTLLVSLLQRLGLGISVREDNGADDNSIAGEVEDGVVVGVSARARAEAILRYPSVCLPPFLFLFPGTLESSFDLVYYRRGGFLVVSIGFLGVLCCLSAFAYLWITATAPEAEVERIKQCPRVRGYLMGTSEWESKEGHRLVVEREGVIFDIYRDMGGARGKYFAVECLVLIPIAMIAPIRTAQWDRCIVKASSMLVLMSVYLAGSLYYDIFLSRFLRQLNIGCYGFMIVGAGFHIVAFAHHDMHHWCIDAGMICFLSGMLCSLLRAIYDVVTFVLDLYTGIRLTERTRPDRYPLRDDLELGSVGSARGGTGGIFDGLEPPPPAPVVLPADSDDEAGGGGLGARRRSSVRSFHSVASSKGGARRASIMSSVAGVMGRLRGASVRSNQASFSGGKAFEGGGGGLSGALLQEDSLATVTEVRSDGGGGDDDDDGSGGSGSGSGEGNGEAGDGQKKAAATPGSAAAAAAPAGRARDSVGAGVSPLDLSGLLGGLKPQSRFGQLPQPTTTAVPVVPPPAVPAPEPAPAATSLLERRDSSGDEDVVPRRRYQRRSRASSVCSDAGSDAAAAAPRRRQRRPSITLSEGEAGARSAAETSPRARTAAVSAATALAREQLLAQQQQQQPPSPSSSSGGSGSPPAQGQLFAPAAEVRRRGGSQFGEQCEGGAGRGRARSSSVSSTGSRHAAAALPPPVPPLIAARKKRGRAGSQYSGASSAGSSAGGSDPSL